MTKLTVNADDFGYSEGVNAGIISDLENKKILANLYIELGQLYTDISKEKELEYYQKGVFMYKELEII